jgi:hypothetical protein
MRLRGLILALLALGMAGTAFDLFLLDHHEDLKQLIPFFVIGMGFAAIAGHLWSGGAASVRLLQAVMTLFLVTGVFGMALHFRGNMEFQLDIDPSLAGWALVSKVIRAKAPPAMAPAAMAQLGLLGLVYCHRHPALARGPRPVSLEPGA